MAQAAHAQSVLTHRPTVDVVTLHPSTIERLPVATVNGIMQDSEGYVWYATEGGGLCRDNGYQVDVFRSDIDHPDMMEGNTVVLMAEAPWGDIWFTCNHGHLYTLRKSDYSVATASSAPHNRHITCIMPGTEDNMWVAYADTVVSVASDGTILDTFHPTISPNTQSGHTPTPLIVAMLQTAGGDIWLLWRHGQISILGTNTHISLPDSITPAYLYKSPHDDSIWLGTWGQGIYHYSMGHWTHATAHEDEPDIMSRRVINMAADKAGTIMWVATIGGIKAYAIMGDTLTPLSTNGIDVSDYSFVPGPLMLDRTDHVWIPSIDPPTFVINRSDQTISHHDLPSTVQGRHYAANIKTIVADSTCLWIHKLHTHLAMYDPTTHTETINTYFTSTQVMTARHGGGAWVADAHGNVWGVTNNSGRLTSIGGTTVPSRVGALADNGNGILAIATADTIYTFNYIDRTRPTAVAAIQSATSMCYTPDGTLYIAASALYTYRHGLSTCISAGSDHITLVAASTNGTVFCTNSLGEVLRIDGSRLVPVTAAYAEHGSTYNAMTFSHDGHLWLAGGKYVKEYNPLNGKCHTLMASEPRIRLTSINTISATTDGVAVGGIGGIAILKKNENHDTHATTGNPHMPEQQPTLTAYAIDGTVHCLSHVDGTHPATVEIDPDISTLDLRLSTFDFTNTPIIRFQYSIDGMTNGWVSMEYGENTIHLTGIKKGDYTLHVRVSKEGDEYTEPVTLLHIRRLPAWWESSWAYTLYIIAALSILLLVWMLYARMAAQRRQFRQLLLLLYTMHHPSPQIAAGRDMLMIESQPASEGEKPADNGTESPPSATPVSDAAEILDEESINLSMWQRQFLYQAINSVRHNIDNSEYSVTHLASDVCMSRSNLYRHILSLTGQTPTDFIRTIRLEKAETLLRTTTKSIAEIADLTGFSSATYFTKCFKQAYGVLPKNYKRHG